MTPIPKGKLAKRRGNRRPQQSTHPSPPSSQSRKRRADSAPRKHPEPDTEVVFSDPYGDDFETESLATPSASSNATSKNSHPPTRPIVFRPGMHQIPEGEALVCDETAYDIFYQCHVEWPSLSFDYICLRSDGHYDNLNPAPLTSYPLSLTLVLGSQTLTPSSNKLTFIRMSNIHRNPRVKSSPANRIVRDRHSDDEDSESDDDSANEASHNSDDDSDDDDDNDDANGKDPSTLSNIDRNAVLQSSHIKADANINRIRVMPQQPNIVAYWTEAGRVNLVDATPALTALHLDSRKRMSHPDAIPPSSVRPFYSSRAHRSEGYALDWSRVKPGHLLSGAKDGGIHLSQPTGSAAVDGFSTSVDRFRGHRASVEDIQWSPNEAGVFASCSADHTIRIWDIREYRRSALGIANAHGADVNVIAWNRIESHLLASGGDDGVIKTWDMRSLKQDADNHGVLPAAEFAMHQKPITSVQWHPTDASTMCASSEDGSVSVWDLAVERDAEEELREGVVVDGAEDLPPQLLFIHMGQKNVKEAQWHPSCQSLMISTAADGVNVFQPSNIALPASR